MPDWGQWKEKQKDFGISGGALFDLVIHDIDFAVFAFAKVDINTATIEQLLQLKGIGEATAAKIVVYRKDHKFSSVDEIVNALIINSIHPFS